MTTDELITQQNFVNALTNGIDIKPQTGGELFSFGARLIKWINDTDNVYWAAWDPKHGSRIILDMDNAELMHLQLKPGKLEFRRNEPGIEHRLEKEFGNGAVGVMLFCMIKYLFEKLPRIFCGETQRVSPIHFGFLYGGKRGPHTKHMAHRDRDLGHSRCLFWYC